MMMPFFQVSTLLLGLCGAELCVGVSCRAEENWQARIDQLANPLIEKHPWAAIAISIRTPSGDHVFRGYGKAGPNELAPSPRTIFQIGSVTKLFTSQLLSLAVERGEVKLNTPVQSLLSEPYVMPRRGAHEISLEELATHSSGLPRLPPNHNRSIGSRGVADPYSGLNVRLLAEGLAECKLSDKEQADIVYSNFGMGLLGHALSDRSGKDYETLIGEEISRPLGLADTFLSASQEQTPRLAQGHNSLGKELPFWTFGMLQGCGALYSTTSDLDIFLAQALTPDDSTFGRAMTLALTPRREISKSTDICLGWHLHKSAPKYWWHNGATYGHSSFVAFGRDPDVTVVVLCSEGFDPLSGTLADRIGVPLIKALCSATSP